MLGGIFMAAFSELFRTGTEDVTFAVVSMLARTAAADSAAVLGRSGLFEAML